MAADDETATPAQAELAARDEVDKNDTKKKLSKGNRYALIGMGLAAVAIVIYLMNRNKSSAAATTTTGTTAATASPQPIILSGSGSGSSGSGSGYGQQNNTMLQQLESGQTSEQASLANLSSGQATEQTALAGLSNSGSSSSGSGGSNTGTSSTTTSSTTSTSGTTSVPTEQQAMSGWSYAGAAAEQQAYASGHNIQIGQVVYNPNGTYANVQSNGTLGPWQG